MVRVGPRGKHGRIDGISVLILSFVEEFLFLQSDRNEKGESVYSLCIQVCENWICCDS